MLNGDFEAPPLGSRNYRQYDAVTDDIVGWTVSSRSVDLVKNSYLNAATSNQWLDVSGADGGSIYQDVPTTPDRSYRIRFQVAGNPMGDVTNGNNVKRLQVWWDGKLVEVIEVDVAGRSKTNMGWEVKEYTRVASEATARLEFRSLTNTAYGPGIDDVSVTQAN